MNYEEVAETCFRILDILDEHKLEVPHGVSSGIRSQVYSMMQRLMIDRTRIESEEDLQMLQEYLEQKP